MLLLCVFFNPYQPSVVFRGEISDLIWSANKMTRFYMNLKTGLNGLNMFLLLGTTFPGTN